MWEQMNKGVPNKTPKILSNKHSSTVNKKSKNSSKVRILFSDPFVMELLRQFSKNVNFLYTSWLEIIYLFLFA